MSDSSTTLLRMANQIAANLSHEPDPARATADHIRMFWDPRMKDMIRAYRGDGLSAAAQRAVHLLDA